LILLEITHGFNQTKHWLSLVVIDCHWLSLIVIDCHVSFAHICPYLSIFVHICPCSSLFILVPICDFPCSLKVRLVVAVSTSQRVGGRRRTGRRCRCAVRWAPRTDDRLGGRFPSEPWTPKK
jgi:hypothetical protein